MRMRWWIALGACWGLCLLCGQGWSQEATAKVPVAGEVSETTGVDEGSGITWALVSVYGVRVSGGAEGVTPPRLTAQCTKDAKGKLKFELMADFGGVEAVTFHAPWKPAKDDLYPPVLPKATVTMEFLGYTKVKPVKRQWEGLPEPRGEIRYAAPGMGSGNMEEVAYYMQYVRSLPTLRLGVEGKGVVEFVTGGWQLKLHNEGLCRMGGF